MKRAAIVVAVLAALAGGDGLIQAQPTPVAEEFRVKREAVFDFAQKPALAVAGDRVTITFETRGFCDVAVAVEDEQGRIVRHLACGVLGPKAPPPLQRNSHAQTIAWDSKDDQGEYVKDKARVSVRVSLGLKAAYERHTLWSPHLRLTSEAGTFCTPGAIPIFAAHPDGVVHCDGRMFDNVRLFGHDGSYRRTIYPFPADRLDKVVGVRRHVFPQSGQSLPYKGGNYQSTLLTGGTNYEGNYLEQFMGVAATAMAVRGDRIALACRKLNRLAIDGSTGGLPLEGPQTHIEDHRPRSAAFSPDGKTLYLAGFSAEHGNPNWYLTWVRGVAKIDFATGEKMELFAGSLSTDAKAGGSEPGQFKTPTSIDCDPQGRVYVTDYYNDRVQIFDPAGKHLKSIAINSPAEVCIDQRNGQIYVFSWYLDDGRFRKGRRPPEPKLTRFGPFDKPDKIDEFALPIPEEQMGMGRYGGDCVQGRMFRAMVDSWSSPDGEPDIWMVRWGTRNRDGGPPHIAQGSPRIYRINKQARSLDLAMDFYEAASQRMGVPLWPGHGKRQMQVRPTTGELYDFSSGNVVDAETGRSRAVTWPFKPVNMAFDMQGMAYLRTHRSIARFDIAGDQWREVPFDYGEEREKCVAAIPINTESIHHPGGIWVSPKGHIVASYVIGKVDGPMGDQKPKEEPPLPAGKPYTPRIFEGRGGNTLVRVWDKHGKLLHEDAVRGCGFLHGLFLDRDDNFYLMAEAQRVGYFDIMTGTLIRFRMNEKVLTDDKPILPLPDKPARPHETMIGGIGRAWWDGAEWFYGGVGFCGKNNSTCHCPRFQATQDYFARTFVPETQHYTVAVLDSAGNLIMRIGQYGNVDDGVPAAAPPNPLPKGVSSQVPNPRKLGGDEVGLFYPAYLAVQTDRRLHIGDPGNARVVSVRLDYQATERVRLKDAGAAD